MDFLTAAKDRIAEATTAVVDVGATAAGTAGDWANAIADSYDRKHKQLMEFAELWMKSKVHCWIKGVVEDVPRRLKEGLKDEWMPKFIDRAKDRLIDGVWPDVQEEIMWEITLIIDEDKDDYERKVEDRGGVDPIRRYLRYHLAPYDQTVWWSLRDPVYVIILLLACVPTYGVFAWTFLVLFFIIDKKDEYQLIYFILWFKGSQFFSWGILKSFVGYFTYFYCATFPEVQIALPGNNTQNGNEPGGQISLGGTCEEAGPGMTTNYQVTAASWVAMLLLCWAALALLPFSQEKGRSKLKAHGTNESQLDVTPSTVGGTITDPDGVVQQTEVKQKTNNSHGYIMYALIWDACWFVMSVGLLVLILFIQPDTNNAGAGRLKGLYDASWQLKQTLFLCQVIYGWSSIIFVPFQVPFLQAVLTHAPPTAYDQKGRCRKYKGPKKKEVKEGTENNRPQFLNRLFSDNELEDFFQKVKTVASGGTVDLDTLRQRASFAREPAGTEDVEAGSPGSARQ